MQGLGSFSLAADTAKVTIDIQGKSNPQSGGKRLFLIIISGELLGKKTVTLEQRNLVFFSQELNSGAFKLPAVTPIFQNEKVIFKIANPLGEYQTIEIFPQQDQQKTLVFHDSIDNQVKTISAVQINDGSKTNPQSLVPNQIVSQANAPSPNSLTPPTAATQVSSAKAAEEDDEFDLSFINKGNKNISQSIVKSLNQVIPGRYSVDLGLNNQYITKIDLEFTRRDTDSNPKACLTAQHIFLLGIKPEKLRPEGAAIFQRSDLTSNIADPKAACLYIEEWVENATESYDKNELILSLFVPQAYVKANKNESLPPNLLTHGENAGFANYNFNYFQSTNQGIHSTAQFLNLDAGVNLFGWQMRQSSYASAGNNSESSFKLGDLSASRTLIAWKSRVSIGAISSQSPVIGSVPVNGVKLFSEEGLMPDEEKSYKPKVRGFARTNARVKIKQNGVGFFEQNIPPGPFEFSDLNPVSNIGDLQVTVSESDGTEQTFIVPYSNTFGKLNQGGYRYNVTFGAYRNAYASNSDQTRPLLQSFVRYGLTDFFTPAIDSLLSENYQSLGTQLNFGNMLGNQSFNIKTSRWLSPQEKSGYQFNTIFLLPQFGLLSFSSNLSYQSKYFVDANTGLNTTSNISTVLAQSLRSTRSVSSGLNFKEWGVLSASLSQQDAWSENSLNNNINLGYSIYFKKINFSTSMSRSKNNFGVNSSKTIDSILFNLSMPLSLFNNNGSLSYNASQSGGSPVSHNMNYSGNYSDDVNYALGYAKRGEDLSQNATLNFEHSRGFTSLGASTDNTGGASASFSASGGLMLHKNGIIASQALGETFGIIEVPGGEGTRASGSKSIVNAQGFGVVPNLSPYSMNIVDLDLTKAPLDVELESSSQRVAPVTGAIVKLSYVSTIGRPLLVHFSGEKIPFGATVLGENDAELGTLGPGNRGLIRVKSNKGRLKVRWGEDPDESCWADYDIKPDQKALNSGYTLMEMACQR